MAGALHLAFGCDVDVLRGEAEVVDSWDESRLLFKATGQNCPRFQRTGSVEAGAILSLGGKPWQVIAAPGHDPVAVILYQSDLMLLVSADSLWQNGFGVVYPELDGVAGFSDVRCTLNRISALDVAWVIPGHGAPFEDVGESLHRAYRRFDGVVQNPERHALHAAKVLVKFHLMEMRQQSIRALWVWLNRTPLIGVMHARYFRTEETNLWSPSFAQLALSAGLQR